MVRHSRKGTAESDELISGVSPGSSQPARSAVHDVERLSETSGHDAFQATEPADKPERTDKQRGNFRADVVLPIVLIAVLCVIVLVVGGDHTP